MTLAALLTAVLAIAVAAAAAPAAEAAGAAPAWRLSIAPQPANLAPGGETEYLLLATNTGAAPTSSAATLEVSLPAGIAAQSATPASCTVEPSHVSCVQSGALQPGANFQVGVAVAAAPGTEGAATVNAALTGGGAPQGATATTTTPVSADPVPFGFLPGFAAPTIGEDGLPASAAGSHPYQLTVDFGFPTESQGDELPNAGHPRDIVVDLPPGFAGDPTAVPALCTEANLESTVSCPAASQVGIVSLEIALGTLPARFDDTPLYAMVPPPGAPAELAFDASGAGTFVHLIAGVRSDSDYGIVTTTPDVLALGAHPVLGARAQIWGDPSAEAHDRVRARGRGNTPQSETPDCLPAEPGLCPVPRRRTPFLTTPGSCPGAPSRFEAHADAWEQPGVFESAAYESADAEGNPVSASGCNALEYEPTIEATPTTDLADSPTGLEFDLRQPQQGPVGEGENALGGRAAAELRDARVTLPEGLVANPSQADGLGACSEEEIGYLGEGHYSKEPQSCPEASKLGTLDVASPLLAEYKNEGTEPVLDPETGAPIPRPLHGSVYLAQPYRNQFGSLLAIYLAVEDKSAGIVAKLAGRVEPDPGSGRLTAVFEENPQLPLQDVHISLFGGNRSSLTTPIDCGTHTTTTDLTPWSSPEGAHAHPSSSFQTTAEPGGGSCPSSEAAAANSPSFSAGTLSPQAGAYSPFVLKLSRNDGSQRLTGIDTALPPGLTGKLAGIAECSEAQIAQARAREHPNQGILERESPSCPSSSEVGTVHVVAGSGPTPFWTSGRAYLAGPYKGAPLSLAVIVPAVAGPFDLGAVVSRVALHVDEETAQIHAVSDPFPTILDGIPLDLRAVSLEMGRPQFTLNPTSCEPLSIVGTATSALGNVASLSNPFQVGGCSSLAFKPHLKISLKGAVKRSGHPALKAVLTMPPGGANIARAQVGLPHALFIDQGNLDKVCTQANLRAATCPPGSVYGHARAISPLLDAPLEGPVYLGVGYGHLLPDLVADLNGQIRILLHGKVDTTKQDGIRNTFEVVPDAPVTKFVLSMKGGRNYSLIENSEPLCAKRQQAGALFAAQNGRVAQFTTKIAVRCPHHKKHKGRHKRAR
jgi:hypothetical protein